VSLKKTAIARCTHAWRGTCVYRVIWSAGVLAAMGNITYPSISAFVSAHASDDQQGLSSITSCWFLYFFIQFRRRRFTHKSWGLSRGSSSHLTRPGLDLIKLAYSMPAVLVTGPTATQNSPFLPSCGRNHRRYSLYRPMDLIGPDGRPAKSGYQSRY